MLLTPTVWFLNISFHFIAQTSSNLCSFHFLNAKSQEANFYWYTAINIDFYWSSAEKGGLNLVKQFSSRWHNYFEIPSGKGGGGGFCCTFLKYNINIDLSFIFGFCSNLENGWANLIKRFHIRWRHFCHEIPPRVGLSFRCENLKYRLLERFLRFLGHFRVQ